MHEALGQTTLQPGDSLLTSGATLHPCSGGAGGAGATGASGAAGGAGATDGSDAAGGSGAAGDSGEAGEALLGVLDLRELARLLTTPANPDRELWLRYLQARAPDLLASLALASRRATAAIPSERWLSELRDYMILRWRRHIGGPQLLDGVSMRDLLVGPMLGEGAFGQVFLARHRALQDRWYAVKRLDTTKMARTARGRQEMRQLEREREVLLLLGRESRGKSDRNLTCQLVTSAHEHGVMDLVMPAVLGGELFNLLEEYGAMSERDVQFYAACLVRALQHLHGFGIVYRDLKCENVLLSGGFTHSSAGWPVLVDFGLANFVKGDGSSMTTFCGTPSFIAPEVARQNDGYGAAADWWSLGVLMYQCLTLATPFEGPNAKATIDNILSGRRIHTAAVRPAGQPLAQGEISEHAHGIIDALMHPDPAERLGGSLHGNEVRVHPFFWGFDWRQIEKRQMTPPHAKVCRERAVKATQHPALRLPPLPALGGEGGDDSVEPKEAATAEKESPADPARAISKAAQEPASKAAPTVAVMPRPERSPTAQEDAWAGGGGDDDMDIGDYV